jgi:hypothetical protein
VLDPSARPPRPRLFWLFALFVGFYSVMRIGIFAMVEAGTIDPGRPVSPEVNFVIAWSQLAIGAAGLAGLAGMALRSRWGTQATVGAAAFTVLFDLWAVAAGFPTAAMGLAPAAVILAYVEGPRVLAPRARPAL